ncbi:YjgN family protein, partial [Neisseria dentiae]|uniref:YjgN family protein n=1 Tax=Neisseria dentiae TaxID=194197 RepID=UPI00211B8F27
KRSMCLAIMAWAVCWKKVLMRNPLNVLEENLGDFREFCKGLRLGGDQFDFTALPSRILIGRLIAVVLFAAFSVLSELDPAYALAVWGVALVAVPWLVRSTMRFRARNSKYGNSRFYFSASQGQTYWLRPLQNSNCYLKNLNSVIPA